MIPWSNKYSESLSVRRSLVLALGAGTSEITPGLIVRRRRIAAPAPESFAGGKLTDARSSSGDCIDLLVRVGPATRTCRLKTFLKQADARHASGDPRSLRKAGSVMRLGDAPAHPALT